MVHSLDRARLALGGGILGACLVGFIGGYTGGAWQIWLGAGIGFSLAYLELGRRPYKGRR